MSINYDKFAALLEKSNISAYKVCKDTGLSSSMFTFWKNGKSTPKSDKIQKIADYFNVPVGYFYEDKDYALGVTEQQAKSLGIDTEAVKQQLNAQLLDEQAIEIAKQIQKLDDTQKMAIEQIIKGLLQGKGKA
nr:MAG: helix-turn-helix domain protein [Bacteriophage sp.]